MCHPARYHQFERDLRERERFAPDLPAGDLRVGDAERERAGELLRVHAAAGRLSTDELEERLEHVYASRTGRDLRAPLADLPADRAAPTAARRNRPVAISPFMLAVLVLLVVAIATQSWGVMFLVWPAALFLGHGPRRRRRLTA